MPAAPAIAAHESQPLQARVVLVTGGAQGIGRGIAQAALGAGASVVIGDLDRDAGKACLREWNVGARAWFRPLDVSREASARRFVAAALERYGRIDGLVNNAGIADPATGPLARLDLAQWRRYLDAHLTGAFPCSKHALPALSERGSGAIVNIASTRSRQSESARPRTSARWRCTCCHRHPDSSPARSS